MNFTIPQQIEEINSKLQSAGYQVYLVGGSVRNLLLEIPVKDWDFTTNAIPEQMLQLFPNGFYDNIFGTVGIPVILEDKQAVVEVTTFRTESNYTDSRHPGTISWGTSIQEDLERRDFTINAIAYNLHKKELVDPFDGQKDLANHIVRAVHNPQERFREDALRLMRAVRFATQLSFTIEDETWKAIQEDAQLLPRISGERLRDELLKILASDYPYEGIMMLKNASLLQHILPELLEGVGISQERPGRHHVYDVFEHNIFSLKFCPSTDPIVRFATLIHDVGKPRVQSADKNGLVIFYNHEVMGAQMAYEICNRLRFSKKERQKVVTLIRWHMFTVDEHITDSAIRRFIRRIGVENVKDMIDLRIGDRLGSGIPEERAESWRLKKFRERIEEQLQPAPFSINDLAIDGNDIMQELHITPGRHVGQLLQKLFEEVDENLEYNNRDHLLQITRKLWETINNTTSIDMTKITLESERLRIVPTSEKYAETIFHEFTDEITKYMFPKTPEKIEETLSYIHSIQSQMENGEEFSVVILKKDTSEFLGGGGIHKLKSGTPEFGIWIKKSAHGNGYGKEAIHALKKWVDEHINYTYLIYPVDKNNIPSRKIAESLGGAIEAEYQKPNMAGNVLDEVEYRIYKRK